MSHICIRVIMQDQEGERPEQEQWRGPCRRLESGRLRKEKEEEARCSEGCAGSGRSGQ